VFHGALLAGVSIGHVASGLLESPYPRKSGIGGNRGSCAQGAGAIFVGFEAMTRKASNFCTEGTAGGGVMKPRKRPRRWQPDGERPTPRNVSVPHGICSFGCVRRRF
jgi:hypothetical protein